MITMTNEKIQKLEARINELSQDRLMLMKKVDELEKKVNELDGIASARLDGLEEDLADATKLARAVAELQQELQRMFPELYIINNIDAPTMVGQR